VPVTLEAKHHANQRYLRYKVFLTSTDVASPTIEDISVIYAQ